MDSSISDVRIREKCIRVWSRPKSMRQIQTMWMHWRSLNSTRNNQGLIVINSISDVAFRRPPIDMLPSNNVEVVPMVFGNIILFLGLLLRFLHLMLKVDLNMKWKRIRLRNVPFANLQGSYYLWITFCRRKRSLVVHIINKTYYIYIIIWSTCK